MSWEKQSSVYPLTTGVVGDQHPAPSMSGRNQRDVCGKKPRANWKLMWEPSRATGQRKVHLELYKKNTGHQNALQNNLTAEVWVVGAVTDDPLQLPSKSGWLALRHSSDPAAVLPLPEILSRLSPAC